MQTSRRYWSNLAWSLWVVVFGVSSATACLDHLTAPHAVHPAACTGSSSPMVQGDDKPILFAENGTFPLPRQILDSVVFPAFLLASFSLVFGLLPQRFFRHHESPAPTVPRRLLLVLQL